VLEIKVLSGGCSRCEKLYKLTRQAVGTLAVDAQVEKVTDSRRIKEYGVGAIPALVINGRVVSSGVVPDIAEVTSFITTALAS
jgi:small redox-active disulfide protein 2